MNAISKDEACEFCKLCEWAYECWITHKRLFDDNPNKDVTIGKFKDFTYRLSIITQEYMLLQICKLHDPAEQSGKYNLTINYIVEHGGWGTENNRIKKLKTQLDDLRNHLLPARNKILSHNDLETIVNGTILGKFPQGMDEKYFAALQELADAVSDKWLGRPVYPFNNLAGADVEEFLAGLETIT